jgi:hypothetical protein
MIAAAGRAGRLSDSRLARVLDAAEEDGFAFVVVEWVDGESLASTLRALGPFPPARATGIVLDVARVIATAHGHGLAHLRLHPGNVVICRTGETKVTDIEVAAALADQPEPADFRRADAEGLGLLLYAALTARWPHGLAYGLPAAPQTADGQIASPRQVRAGIPREVESVVDRTVSATPRRGLEPLRTPSAVAAALAALPQARPDDDELVTTELREPGPARQVLRIAVPVAAVIAVVVIAWLSGLALGRVPGPGSGFASTATGTPSPGSSVGGIAKIASVRDFDPYGDRQENADQAPYAFDGDTSTAWQTGLYRRRPDFGGLKPGVGLVIDLGRAQPISEVTALLTKAGADLELRVADQSATAAPQQLAGYRLAASAKDAGDKPPKGAPKGTVVLKPESRTIARFWLLWLTSVPQDGSGYRDGIAELTFRG